MEPEKLKVIAEGMGYVQEGVINGRPLYQNSGGIFTYDPHINAEQCMEIMEKLKIQLGCNRDGSEWSAWPYVDTSMDISYSKTINEAVCNAAFEYFKEVCCE